MRELAFRKPLFCFINSAMSIDSFRRKICKLAYSNDTSDLLRPRLLGFLTRQEMDFVDLHDFPNMKAYLGRFKNLFTQYEMYDGRLSEKEKCEIILLSLPAGYLSMEAGAANLGVYTHLPTLMAELFQIERAKKFEAAIEAGDVGESSTRQIPREKDERRQADESSTAGENSASCSFSWASATSSSSSGSSTLA